jgi:diaminohydroxyphosphoribosylaminopyrimidine deaminase / 5-amino-6-(5-phosphoribosylamino)uracil reductase
MIGVATASEDDPMLTCRLPGLADRSPTRIVLDAGLQLSPDSRLARSARDVPTLIATLDVSSPRTERLRAAGCGFLACEAEPETGRIALPELMDDLGATGVSTLLVEAGARLGASMLGQGLVDRLILVEGNREIGTDGVPAPFEPRTPPAGFEVVADMRFGTDRWREFERIG